jgi:hypothetical protein
MIGLTKLKAPPVKTRYGCVILSPVGAKALACVGLRPFAASRLGVTKWLCFHGSLRPETPVLVPGRKGGPPEAGTASR